MKMLFFQNLEAKMAQTGSLSYYAILLDVLHSQKCTKVLLSSDYYKVDSECFCSHRHQHCYLEHSVIFLRYIEENEKREYEYLNNSETL